MLSAKPPKCPTVELVRQVLDYDAETGVFRARVGTGTRKAGTVVPGSRSSHGYLQVCVGGRQFYAHRLAWAHFHGVWPDSHIDHIDGDRTNNAISNLRSVTQATNNQNLRRPKKGSQVGLLGVTMSGSRYRASITDGYKAIHLGLFDTAEEAHAAYLEKKRELHGGCTL